MLKKTVAICLFVAGSMALTSCDQMYRTDKSGHKHLTNTAAGVGIGAVGGAVVGSAIGGTQGAVIGTATGAVAGGVVGNQMDH